MRLTILSIFAACLSAVFLSCGTDKPEPPQPPGTGGNGDDQPPVVERPDWKSDPALKTLKAFPEAEGFGAETTGGRGGKILYVVRLEDDANAGSLRWALNQQGKRTVMFQVAGVIALKNSLEIKNGDLTIAGQSAPGNGICISGYPVILKADNVIVRHLRFRMGDATKQENDAFWGRNQKNIIIDHCSMSWSTDECASFYDNENFTLQWCILSESLRISTHSKGAHGYGGIWGGHGASFHHNLLAHHDSRNPRFCGSRYSNQPDLEMVDFRNNVIYNWGSNSGYAGEGGSYNIVGNYYKPGPETSNPARIFQPNADDGSNQQPAGIWGKFHVSGNYMLNRDGSPNTAINADNWAGMTPNPSSKSKDELKSISEFAKGSITTQSAQEAYEQVLQKSGASFRRDATDTRLINEVRNGLAPVRAYFTLHADERPSGVTATKAGLIDSQNDVNGWDAYVFKTEDVPVDTDGDGMPDAWETANALNPKNASDGATNTLSGTYPNLEVYLYSLTKE
ncbi:MAG: pectate lyase [Bacteroidales bacterium]|jgi:pectate lyase|nr:pectate lyase [Bacteroidales bacterium]